MHRLSCHVDAKNSSRKMTRHSAAESSAFFPSLELFSFKPSLPSVFLWPPCFFIVPVLTVSDGSAHWALIGFPSEWCGQRQLQFSPQTRAIAWATFAQWLRKQWERYFPPAFPKWTEFEFIPGSYHLEKSLAPGIGINRWGRWLAVAGQEQAWRWIICWYTCLSLWHKLGPNLYHIHMLTF